MGVTLGVTLGRYNKSFLNIDLFFNSIQAIGPKGFKHTQFNEDHSGVVIRKFSEDRFVL